MPTFQKNQNIGAYIVQFPIKPGDYAETSRVKDASGKNYFLKLFNYAKLQHYQFDEEGRVIEIEVAKQLNHPNLSHYHDSGDLMIDGRQYGYFVMDFISGETVAQKTERAQRCSVFEAKRIVAGVLEGLKYLHSLPDPITHNELTVENVMLDMSFTPPQPKIIDFGFARMSSLKRMKVPLQNRNPYVLSNETFNGTYTQQSDMYSVGAMLYRLLFGMVPYYTNTSAFQSQDVLNDVIEAKTRPLTFPSIELFEFDEQLQNTIKIALCDDVDVRFKTAEEFLDALIGKTQVDNPDDKRKVNSAPQQHGSTITQRIPQGEGFSAIAGMAELKALIKRDVIDVVTDPETSAQYGLSIPNGMLLYGPPGCGKTFFAKHLAEEIGFNYMEVTPADLKSRWVNASQENIKKMFDEAAKNVPTVIFIDEINELVPDRDDRNVHEMSQSAVEEMLAQMDRTGEKGIFVIGATNLPQKIDKAMLRAGRLERKYYIGPPDQEARKALFEMYLSKRSKVVDFGVDYERLAQKTEYFISADIRFIVDDAARAARDSRSKITMALLEETIENTTPSISRQALEQYAAIQKIMEDNQTTQKQLTRNKIGFK